MTYWAHESEGSSLRILRKPLMAPDALLLEKIEAQFIGLGNGQFSPQYEVRLELLLELVERAEWSISSIAIIIEGMKNLPMELKERKLPELAGYAERTISTLRSRSI